MPLLRGLAIPQLMSLAIGVRTKMSILLIIKGPLSAAAAELEQRGLEPLSLYMNRPDEICIHVPDAQQRAVIEWFCEEPVGRTTPGAPLPAGSLLWYRL